MQTINKLLDTALKACNEPSDRQLAKHLDVSPSAISLWRKGKPIKDEHLMALIRLAQADPTIAVLVRTESAESPEARKAWSVVWDRLSPVTTVVGAMVLTIGMMPATGRTKTLEIQGFERPDFAYSVYYVRSRRALDVAEHENLQSMVACHEDGSQPFQKLTAAAGVAVNHRGTSSRTGGVSTDALESAYPLFHSIGPPIAHHGA